MGWPQKLIYRYLWKLKVIKEDEHHQRLYNFNYYHIWKINMTRKKVVFRNSFSKRNEYSFLIAIVTLLKVSIYTSQIFYQINFFAPHNSKSVIYKINKKEFKNYILWWLKKEMFTLKIDKLLKYFWTLWTRHIF